MRETQELGNIYIMKTRTYQNTDFDAVFGVLKESKHLEELLTYKVLNEKLYDDPYWNPEYAFVAETKGQIVGFMQGVRRDIRGTKYGFIKLMGVHPKYQRQGIASKMYKQLEAIFVADQVEIVRIYDVPLNYFMPGVDPRYTPAVCFAQKHGFKHIGDSVNMSVNLDQNFEVTKEIEALKAQGIEISRATKKDKRALFGFVNVEWALWINELEMTFKSDPISMFIARKEGIIKAFSAYDGNNKGTGWFGPMGTHQDLRGLGMGNILLKLCLQDMKGQGLTKSIIPWVAPIGFYSHYVGAKISRVFWRYQKKLS